MTAHYTTQTGIEMLYRETDLTSVMFEKNIVEKYNSVCDTLELAPITDYIDYNLDFKIPQYYKEINVRDYVYNKLKDRHSTVPAEIQQRVEHELDLFEVKKLFPVLKTLIYIVDTMKKNNIVWGVGRGSSVASYCLYLLEVHCIDSIKYNLDIREFLR